MELIATYMVTISAFLQMVATIVLVIVTNKYVKKTSEMAQTMRESNEAQEGREKTRADILRIFLRERSNQTIKMLAEKTGKTSDEIIFELPYLLKPHGPIIAWARSKENELFFGFPVEYRG